jgi:hypothetical protein
MKSNEALLGPVGNNKTNGKQAYFLVTSKKVVTFFKERRSGFGWTFQRLTSSWIFFLQEILLLLFTHRTFTNPLSLSFSSYERYFDH